MLPWQRFLAFCIWGVHWRQLVNVTELSMCSGDAALCQITLTACYRQRPILRFFARQGRHVAPMGVKFGTEEVRAKFHPHRCNDKGIGPPKLKFLLRLDQNVEYKCPAGEYPLHDFQKICRVCTPFQDALAVKISLDLLKGLWSYGGFKLTGPGYPQIFSAP